MNQDEREFAELIEALRLARIEYIEIREEFDYESRQDDDKLSLTPTSIGDYKRRIEWLADAKNQISLALAKFYKASEALDDWLPTPIQEKLDKGEIIIAPSCSGFVGLGKTAMGIYYMIFGESLHALKHNIQQIAPEVSGRGQEAFCSIT